MPALGFVRLAHANSAALESALVSGQAPEPERLLGAEWRGYNISSLTRLTHNAADSVTPKTKNSDGM